MSNKSKFSEKSTGLGYPAGLENCSFFYGHGMKRTWIENNALILDCVGERSGQSAQASFMAGELVMAEVEKTLAPHIKTEQEKISHLVVL